MKCIFCQFDGTLEELKAHSATCPHHPAVKALLESGQGPIDLALDKSAVDHFEYLAILKNGFVFFYEDAVYCREDWVHFSGIMWVYPELRSSEARHYGRTVDSTSPGFLDRGLDVRRSEIAACADAPMGS